MAPGKATQATAAEVARELATRAAAVPVPAGDVDVAMKASTDVGAAEMPADVPRPGRTIGEGLAFWDLDFQDQAKRARVAAVDVSEPLELDTVDELDWMAEAAEVAAEAWETLAENAVEDLRLAENRRKEIEEFKAFEAFTPVPADSVKGLGKLVLKTRWVDAEEKSRFVTKEFAT